MRFSDVIELVVINKTEQDENGYEKPVGPDDKTEVFANKKSVRSSEFYLAAQTGEALEVMFEIRSIDYNSQDYIDYESKRYEVVRTYDRGEIVEVICKAYEGEG
ncbi:phage head closure protein [Priestia megaterium]